MSEGHIRFEEDPAREYPIEQITVHRPPPVMHTYLSGHRVTAQPGGPFEFLFVGPGTIPDISTLDTLTVEYHAPGGPIVRIPDAFVTGYWTHFEVGRPLTYQVSIQGTPHAAPGGPP